MTETDFAAWLEDDTAQRVVLYHVHALQGDTPVVLRLSSHPYGNDPAGPYLPIVAEGLVYTEAITEDGSPRVSASAIKVWNIDHEHDDWLEYVFAGQNVEVYLGDARWPFADFSLECKLVLDDIDASDSDEQSGSTLTFKTRDVMDRLNAPLSELTMPDGSLWPLTFGEVANITPKVKNASTNEFTYHPTATEGLIAARVEGKKRTATVTEDAANGSFTVSSGIVGALTASVQGDKAGGIYRHTISTLVRHIVKNYGPAATRFTEAEIDGASFDAFEVANPHAVGLYLTDRALIVEACAKLASSVRAQLVPSPTGKLRLLQYAVPALAFDEIRQRHYELTPNVRVVSRPAVAAAVTVGYCRNYTPQPNLQTTLPTEHKAALAEEWRQATSKNQAVADRYKLSTAAKMRETCLLNSEDATTEAQRDRAQVSTQRTIYAVAGMPPLLRRTLGQGVILFGDYYGLQAGKIGQITLRTIDFNTLTIHTEVRV